MLTARTPLYVSFAYATWRTFWLHYVMRMLRRSYFIIGVLVCCYCRRLQRDMNVIADNGWTALVAADFGRSSFDLTDVPQTSLLHHRRFHKVKEMEKKRGDDHYYGEEVEAPLLAHSSACCLLPQPAQSLVRASRTHYNTYIHLQTTDRYTHSVLRRIFYHMIKVNKQVPCTGFFRRISIPFSSRPLKTNVICYWSVFAKPPRTSMRFIHPLVHLSSRPFPHLHVCSVCVRGCQCTFLVGICIYVYPLTDRSR